MRKESIEQALQNWALWRCGGWTRVHSSADVDPKKAETRPPPDEPHYREATVPCDDGYGEDVDNIVNALHRDLQAVLRAEYLGRDPFGVAITLLTQEQRAAWLACSLSTYERRLREARDAVGNGLDAREQRMREAREVHGESQR